MVLELLVVLKNLWVHKNIRIVQIKWNHILEAIRMTMLKITTITHHQLQESKVAEAKTKIAGRTLEIKNKNNPNSKIIFRSLEREHHLKIQTQATKKARSNKTWVVWEIYQISEKLVNIRVLHNSRRTTTLILLDLMILEMTMKKKNKTRIIWANFQMLKSTWMILKMKSEMASRSKSSGLMPGLGLLQLQVERKIKSNLAINSVKTMTMKMMLMIWLRKIFKQKEMMVMKIRLSPPLDTKPVSQ